MTDRAEKQMDGSFNVVAPKALTWKVQTAKGRRYVHCPADPGDYEKGKNAGERRIGKHTLQNYPDGSTVMVDPDSKWTVCGQTGGSEWWIGNWDVVGDMREVNFFIECGPFPTPEEAVAAWEMLR